MENFNNLENQIPKLDLKTQLNEIKQTPEELKKAKIDKLLSDFSLKVEQTLAWVEKFNSDKTILWEYISNLSEEDTIWISNIFEQFRIDNNLQLV